MASHFGEKPCFIRRGQYSAAVKVINRGRTGLCGVALLVGLAACQGEVNYDEPQKSDGPNIVLLMSDDQGWGDVGYNGNAIVQTRTWT